MAKKVFNDIKNKSLLNLIDEQINAEFVASYSYLSASCQISSLGWNGIAKFLHQQYNEEKKHADEIISFAQLLSHNVLFKNISVIEMTKKNVLYLLNQLLKMEIENTKKINNILTISLNENNFAVFNFFQSFANDQLLDINKLSTLIQKLSLDKNEAELWYVIDQEYDKMYN